MAMVGVAFLGTTLVAQPTPQVKLEVDAVHYWHPSEISITVTNTGPIDVWLEPPKPYCQMEKHNPDGDLWVDMGLGQPKQSPWKTQPLDEVIRLGRGKSIALLLDWESKVLEYDAQRDYEWALRLKQEWEIRRGERQQVDVDPIEYPFEGVVRLRMQFATSPWSLSQQPVNVLSVVSEPFELMVEESRITTP